MAQPVSQPAVYANGLTDTTDDFWNSKNLNLLPLLFDIVVV
jgi:hypothetical protein